MFRDQRLPPVSTGAAQRALLHPLWLGGLVLLAVNDHVLKGGTLLPDVVTGKLSDVAGMLVAPALLATALGVKSRRGWIAAHVAVGSVFAAIKLSTFCASLWSSLMAAFGFAWTIVVDPTDLLVAIPALFVGAFVLGRAMTASPARLVRRSAEATAAGIGLMCSVATSPPPEESGPWPEEEWLPEINADVWVHNGTGAAQVIRVRPLLTTVNLDCDAIETDPAGLLSDTLFGQVQSWTVPDNANLAVLDPGFNSGIGCRVALVDADELAPVILFWRNGSPPTTWVSGSGQVGGAGEVELVLDQDHEGEDELHLEASSEIVFPRGESSEPIGECAAQDDAYRVDWDDSLPQGIYRIVSMSYGVDGCTALELAYPQDESGTTRRTYICTPPLDLPFVEGDEITIAMEYGVEWEAVVVRAEAPTRGLVVSRGGGTPIVSGLQIAVAPLYGCDYSVDACGTVAQSSAVTLGGGNYPSAQVMFNAAPVVLDGDDGVTITVAVAHAQNRVAFDSDCAAGSDGLGDDIELALVIEEPVQ